MDSLHAHAYIKGQQARYERKAIWNISEGIYTKLPFVFRLPVHSFLIRSGGYRSAFRQPGYSALALFVAGNIFKIENRLVGKYYDRKMFRLVNVKTESSDWTHWDQKHLAGYYLDQKTC